MFPGGAMGQRFVRCCVLQARHLVMSAGALASIVPLLGAGRC